MTYAGWFTRGRCRIPHYCTATLIPHTKSALRPVPCACILFVSPPPSAGLGDCPSFSRVRRRRPWHSEALSTDHKTVLPHTRPVPASQPCPSFLACSTPACLSGCVTGYYIRRRSRALARHLSFISKCLSQFDTQRWYSLSKRMDIRRRSRALVRHLSFISKHLSQFDTQRWYSLSKRTHNTCTAANGM